MNISLQNIGKRFNREWIFRHLHYEFVHGKSYAITGTNGSGKSTLLQVIAGATLHSEGEISFQGAKGSGQLAAEKIYENIAIAAPYLDLIEEMTALEFLQFHSSFKALTKPFAEILATVGLANAANKQIRYYSSGMKQRLKLAQAFFSNTTVLLLDEPTTNLDEEGIVIYQKLWSNYTTNKLVIVSSNDKIEFEKCEAVISIVNYK